MVRARISRWRWSSFNLSWSLGKDKWGRVQCHFIQMGGVVISHGDQERPIDLSRVKGGELEEIIQPSRIDEADILDRSKGDELSKGLVVIQTTWFIISCCARAIEKLTITNLEIITLAYAALNGMMYFFWWDKPLNVRVAQKVITEDWELFDRVSRKVVSGEGQGNDGGAFPTVPHLSMGPCYSFAE